VVLAPLLLYSLELIYLVIGGISMKNIELVSWKETNEKGKEIILTTANLITTIISTALMKENLTGFDNLRLINRLATAVDNIKDNKLSLEDADFEILKNWFEKYTPAQWGKMPEVYNALKVFL